MPTRWISVRRWAPLFVSGLAETYTTPHSSNSSYASIRPGEGSSVPLFLGLHLEMDTPPKNSFPAENVNRCMTIGLQQRSESLQVAPL